MGDDLYIERARRLVDVIHRTDPLSFAPGKTGMPRSTRAALVAIHKGVATLLELDAECVSSLARRGYIAVAKAHRRGLILSIAAAYRLAHENNVSPRACAKGPSFDWSRAACITRDGMLAIARLRSAITLRDVPFRCGGDCGWRPEWNDYGFWTRRSLLSEVIFSPTERDAKAKGGRVIHCIKPHPAEQECPIASLQLAITTDPQDWSLSKRDAWVYGVIVGWDGDDGDREAMRELAKKHRWTKETVSRLRRLHAAFTAMHLQCHPAKGGGDELAV